MSDDLKILPGQVTQLTTTLLPDPPFSVTYGKHGQTITQGEPPRWNRSLDPLLRQKCAMEDALEAVLFMRRTASNNPPGDSQATMMLHEMLEG